jgi:hypothetical protein
VKEKQATEEYFTRRPIYFSVRFPQWNWRMKKKGSKTLREIEKVEEKKSLFDTNPN